MVEVMISKLAYRVPQLLARALAGDPFAIGMLAAMGITIAANALKKDK